MKKHNKKDLTQVKGGFVGAGSTFERVGSFVFMNIYKPKPLPIAECDDQIEDLQMRKEYEDYRCQRGEITDLQCAFLKDEHQLKIMYYQRCKKLTLKP